LESASQHPTTQALETFSRLPKGKQNPATTPPTENPFNIRNLIVRRVKKKASPLLGFFFEEMGRNLLNMIFLICAFYFFPLNPLE
jgi:hypothetical protein